jgi:small subunit ribosomal protein S16
LLAIRLTRVGKKNQPYFRIVVQEKSAPVKGKFIEIIGNWNPRTGELKVDKEKLAAWRAKGAQLSATAAFLIEGKPKPKKPEKGPKKQLAETAKAPEMSKEEKAEPEGPQTQQPQTSPEESAPAQAEANPPAENTDKVESDLSAEAEAKADTTA